LPASRNQREFDNDGRSIHGPRGDRHQVLICDRGRVRIDASRAGYGCENLFSQLLAEFERDGDEKNSGNGVSGGTQNSTCSRRRVSHEPRSQMPTLIIGLGNEFAGDDGIGIRVARVLVESHLSPDIDVIVRPSLGFGLLDAMETSERIVLVDAMSMGGEAGACVVYDAITGDIRVRWSRAPICSELRMYSKSLDACRRGMRSRPCRSLASRECISMIATRN